MATTQPQARNLRKGRHSQPGHYYFLTTSVADRRRIFTQQQHAVVMLDAVCWLHNAGRLFVDAAVVMPDHVHIAGKLGESILAKLMHTLKGYTAKRLARAGVETPVWQKGFHDHAIRDDEDYRIRVQYLLDNPVRAGLVEHAREYPFVILPSWWE